MAGFKFRLETVLGLAIRIQDQKAQAMADAQAALQAEEARLQGYLSQQAATRVELLAAQQQGDLQSILWGLDLLARLAGQEAP